MAPPADPAVNITHSQCNAPDNDYLLTLPLMKTFYVTEDLATY